MADDVLAALSERSRKVARLEEDVAAVIDPQRKRILVAGWLADAFNFPISIAVIGGRRFYRG